MKNVLILLFVSIFLYFIIKKMSIWVNIHMSGKEFIAFILVIVGIGVFLASRFKSNSI